MRQIALLIVLWTTPALATEFPIQSFQNAEIHQLGQPARLEHDFRALTRRIDQPAWVAYAVPRVPRSHHHDHHQASMGDGSMEDGSMQDGSMQDCGTYYLEKRPRGLKGHGYHDDGRSETFLVLLRVEGGEVRKIKGLPTGCDIDAGGLSVHVFSSVEPHQSLDLIVSLAEDAGKHNAGKHDREAALFVIAQHDLPKVDHLLEEIATGKRDWDEQNQAVFWLGAARGDRGFEILRRLAQNEDDADLRHHVTFGIYVGKAPGAVPLLIEMARQDASKDVRRQALFWLGQEASREAIDELERATEEDPDVEVKKHAVFALSQLPADQSVPLLIRHAKTHPHPAVRKQALFWLGQSGDERALEFFETILMK